MSGNVPNVSYNCFDPSKCYEGIALQQGVPVADSDINDNTDCARFNLMNALMRVIGDGFYPASVTSLLLGYSVLRDPRAIVGDNNFEITGGWAVVSGLLVPTVWGNIAADHYYEDDTNFMFVGEVSGVAGVNLSDVDKYFLAEHELVGCRVKMTSGAESGNTFTVVSRVDATTLEMTGVGAIAPGDTYLIKPPVLTTPAGAIRTDAVYLKVWLEDINDNEDPDLVNPILGVEAAHRIQRRWCVRVKEGGAMPAYPADHTSFGVRHKLMATVVRQIGVPKYESAGITMAFQQTHLSDLAADTLQYASSPLFFGSSIADAMVGCEANLASQLAPAGETFLGGRVLADTPSSLAAGTLEARMIELLGHVNDRINTVHPTALSDDYVLLWRSNGITLDADVDANTVSLYWRNGTFLAVTGGYAQFTNVISGKDNDSFVSIIYQSSKSAEKYQSIRATKRVAVAATVLTVNNPTHWDTFDAIGRVDDALDNLAVVSSIVPVDTGNLYSTRTYSGKVLGASMQGFGTAVNCAWNASTNKWVADRVDSPSVVQVVSSGGVYTAFKRAGDNAVDWTNIQWTTIRQMGSTAGQEWASDLITGAVDETVPFAMSAQDNTGVNTIFTVYQAVRWANRIPGIVAGDVTHSVEGSGNWDSILISSVDQYGCVLVGTSLDLNSAVGFIRGKVLVNKTV